MGHTQFSANAFVKLDFAEDTSEDAPICRWQHGLIKLDLMPLDERHLQTGLCHHSKLRGSRNITADSAARLAVKASGVSLSALLEGWQNLDRSPRLLFGKPQFVNTLQIQPKLGFRRAALSIRENAVTRFPIAKSLVLLPR